MDGVGQYRQTLVGQSISYLMPLWSTRPINDLKELLLEDKNRVVPWSWSSCMVSWRYVNAYTKLIRWIFSRLWGQTSPIFVNKKTSGHGIERIRGMIWKWGGNKNVAVFITKSTEIRLLPSEAKMVSPPSEGGWSFPQSGCPCLLLPR